VLVDRRKLLGLRPQIGGFPFDDLPRRAAFLLNGDISRPDQFVAGLGGLLKSLGYRPLASVRLEKFRQADLTVLARDLDPVIGFIAAVAATIVASTSFTFRRKFVAA